MNRRGWKDILLRAAVAAGCILQLVLLFRMWTR